MMTKSVKLSANLTVACLLISLLTLNACQKKDETTKGVDSNGFCTYSFISDYNDVIYDTKDLNTAYSASPLNESVIADKAFNLKISSGKFASNQSDTSCKAMDTTTLKTVSVSDASLAANSVMANGLVATRRAGKPLPSKASDVFTGAEQTSLLDLTTID